MKGFPAGQAVANPELLVPQTSFTYQNFLFEQSGRMHVVTREWFEQNLPKKGREGPAGTFPESTGALWPLLSPSTMSAGSSSLKVL